MNEAGALMLRGMIMKETPENQVKYADAEKELNAVIEKHGDFGKKALIIRVMEIAEEQK